jgi:hypothetical protein
VTLRHGDDLFLVRDQSPLKHLDACLHPGVTAQDFLDALNGRVFFWLSRDRVQRLLDARASRGRDHLLLELDTAALLADHGHEVELSPYNTGSTHVPTAPRRGPDVFVPLHLYPFDEWARRRGSRGEAAVELTVPYAVPRAMRYVETVSVIASGAATGRRR